MLPKAPPSRNGHSTQAGRPGRSRRTRAVDGHRFGMWLCRSRRSIHCRPYRTRPPLPTPNRPGPPRRRPCRRLPAGAGAEPDRRRSAPEHARPSASRSIVGGGQSAPPPRRPPPPRPPPGPAPRRRQPSSDVVVALRRAAPTALASWPPARPATGRGCLTSHLRPRRPPSRWNALVAAQ